MLAVYPDASLLFFLVNRILILFRFSPSSIQPHTSQDGVVPCVGSTQFSLTFLEQILAGARDAILTHGKHGEFDVASAGEFS